MTTIVNNAPPGHEQREDSGFGFIIAGIIIAILVVLFLAFGLPTFGNKPPVEVPVENTTNTTNTTNNSSSTINIQLPATSTNNI